MRVMLVGSPGRTPFTGHFRGRWAAGPITLAWAGRIRPSAAPAEAWEAAEQASLVVSSAVAAAGADRFAVIESAWKALRTMDRGDLSVLFVAQDSDGTSVSASGLAELKADGIDVVPAGHPLLGEPGIPERTGFFQPDRPATDWVGVPVGARWPTTDVLLACGWRNG